MATCYKLDLVCDRTVIDLDENSVDSTQEKWPWP